MAVGRRHIKIVVVYGHVKPSSFGTEFEVLSMDLLALGVGAKLVTGPASVDSGREL